MPVHFFTQQKVIAYGLIFMIAIISFWSLRQLSPPAVNDDINDFSLFSATRAHEKLKIIAREPHPGGTAAHEKVKNYIVTYCEGKGLETQVQQETGVRLANNRVIAGSPKNVIATLRGTGEGRSIVVMAHYDSQPNTPGAADDGSGVAAMLEVIDVLTRKPRLKNDIVFLFTDLEEVGLLGAEAFTNNLALMKNVALVLNFEARGNDGVSLTFETSENNGWIIRHFAEAVHRPVANALAYEVYRRMPNYTDFTLFKDKNVSGLNSAFIDGHAYYHSPADTPDKINLRSVQHQGDHMLGMIRHFGNLELASTKSDDVIYFNLFGTVLIYSIEWDYALMILAIVLYGVFVAAGFIKKRIRIGHYLAAIGLYLLSIGFSIAFVFVLQELVSALYPHYSNFYNSNFYNANLYLLAITGLSLLSFSLVFAFALKRFTLESLLAGSMLILMMVMIVLKMSIDTAAYLIYIPLLPAILISLFRLFYQDPSPRGVLINAATSLLLLLLPIVLWAPLVFTLFLAFGFSLPYAPALILVFFFPPLLPALKIVSESNRWMFMAFSALLLVGGLLAAHLNSGYSDEQPLQSEMMYAIDMDSQQAFWISTQKHKDNWNGEYLIGDSIEPFNEFFPNLNFMTWKGKARMSDVVTTSLEKVQDTLMADYRYLKIRFSPDSQTVALDVWLPQTAVAIQVNERNVTSETRGSNRVNFYAPGGKPVEIVFIVPLSGKVSLRLIEKKAGIPADLLVAPMPASVIPSPGSFSNCTQIKQSIDL
jgi:hypothetical protein